MVDDAETSRIRETLAANLRRLRIARHLSLSELARATQMSKATLSSIENGRANPTVETLAALAEALRIPLRELLEELPLGDIRIVRAAGAEPEALDGLPQRPLEALAGDGAVSVAELVLPARHLHEVGAKVVGSRAHVYVLSGKLLAGPVERITELTPGDYASFPADVPHSYETERQPVRALLLLQGGGRALRPGRA
jgi:XRE family transcriptional regulator, regulator of sulfur utilization